jgi:hypothetical protein
MQIDSMILENMCNREYVNLLLKYNGLAREHANLLLEFNELTKMYIELQCKYSAALDREIEHLYDKLK